MGKESLVVFVTINREVSKGTGGQPEVTTESTPFVEGKSFHSTATTDHFSSLYK